MLIKKLNRPLLIHGFTLIEVLIALFIFTLVSVILTTGLHSVFQSQERTEKHASRLATLQMTLLLLSRDIEQTVNRPIINAKGMVEGALIGSPRSIVFTHAGWANPLGQLPRSTLKRSRYFIEKNNFIREDWAVLDQSAKTLPAARQLLANVRDMHFDYLDHKNQFQNNWPPNENQLTLPKGVRVHFTLKNWGSISQLYLLASQEENTKAEPKNE